MNKNELKKEYENIRISEEEKNRIYNNILSNKKKSFNFFPIMSLGFVAVIVGIFFFINQNTLLKQKIPVLKGDITLENNYRRELVVNAISYLNENKIDINNLKDNEELKIDSKKIIDKEEYNTCNGNLIIKKYNDDYTYSTDVSCGATDNGKIEYKIYDGYLRNVFEVNESVFLASYADYSYKEGEVTDQNKNVTKMQYINNSKANLTLVDDSGNIIWNKLIDTKYNDENSIVTVTDIKKIDNEYYVIVSIEHEYSYQSNGNVSSSRKNYYLLILDNNGNELQYLSIDRENTQIAIDNYIGYEDNRVYYTASVCDFLTHETKDVIVELRPSGMSYIDYEKIPSDMIAVNDNNIVNRVITNYYNGAFYGYTYTKTSTMYYSKYIFKLDSLGNLLWEIPVHQLDSDTGEMYIKNIVINNNILYVIYTDDNNYRIQEYTTDFKFIKEYDFTNIIDEKVFYNKFYVEKDKYVFGLNTNNNIDYSYVITNSKYEKEKEIKVITDKSIKDYKWSNILYRRLKNDKVNMIYSVSKDLGKESILLVFYK